jgi:hypothetical protein
MILDINNNYKAMHIFKKTPYYEKLFLLSKYLAILIYSSKLSILNIKNS